MAQSSLNVPRTAPSLNDGLRAEATAAHDRGWVLIPLRGKRPVLKDWTHAPRPTLSDVETWAQQGNIGVRTGAISGIVVIDDDSQSGPAIEQLKLPQTVTATTGSGGTHYYFHSPAGGLANSVGRLAPAVDVRGDGGQVVLPGSIHPTTKKPYRWAPGLSPDEIALATLPAHIIDTLQSTDVLPHSRPRETRQTASDPQSHPLGHRYARSVLRKAASRITTAGEGSRNDTLNREAHAVGAYVGAALLDDTDAESALAEAARASGLEDSEITATVRSGLNAGTAKPIDADDLERSLAETRSPRRKRQRSPSAAERHFTDLGNAERLIDQHGDDILYCGPWAKWLVWDGSRWERDRSDVIMSLATDTIRTLGKVADSSGDEEQAKWAHTSESLARLRSMVTIAQSKCPVLPEDLNRKDYLLNCRNGTLVLKSGTLRAARRADSLTQLCPTDYDENAPCPLWEDFQTRILPDDELREYVHRAVGYAISGDVSEQVLFFLFGEGANGKSTFLNVLLDVLGPDYAFQAPPDILLQRQGERHPTELVGLFGQRMALCVEAGMRRSFNETLIKQLTGGERVSARRMREDFWDFQPTHHLFLAANHRPAINGTDEGIWRRIHLIPFTERIPEQERDPDLRRKLLREAKGILAWAVRGFRTWHKQRLNPPASVRAATDSYRDEMDVIGAFLGAVTRAKKDGRVSASRLYAEYRGWCEKSGEAYSSKREFGSAMTERGARRKKANGNNVYLGIELISGGNGEDGDNE